MTAGAICVGGLIEHPTADGPEQWACHGCPGCTEPAEVHPLSCAVWRSEEPCDCGALEGAAVSTHIDAMRILSAEQSPMGVAARKTLEDLTEALAAIARLEADVAERARLTTLGGPPPRPSVAWSNPATTVDVHHDYRGWL